MIIHSLKSKVHCLLLIIIFVQMGCDAVVRSGFRTPEQVINSKGQPNNELSESDLNPSRLLIYKDKTTYQIEDERVRAEFRQPTNDEVSLQYWLQRWKGQVYKTSKVNEEGDSHVESKFYYNEQLGEGVIYEVPTNKVIRVVKTNPVAREP